MTLVLPLSALVAFIALRAFGYSANLMSLGGLAIGIGMIVDGAVVVTENIYRHLAEDGERRNIVEVVRGVRRRSGAPDGLRDLGSSRSCSCPFASRVSKARCSRRLPSRSRRRLWGRSCFRSRSFRWRRRCS